MLAGWSTMITTVDNDVKERLCIAYVTAVAARAGCQLSEPHLDRNKIDATISAVKGTPARIDIQLKATSANIVRDTHAVFPLEVETYDRLRDTVILAPQLLVVLVLPEGSDDWLTANEDKLIARQCAYWLDLCGFPSTANERTINVHLPRTQVFTPQALKDLMNMTHARLAGDTT